jgi:hypothetical protein
VKEREGEKESEREREREKELMKRLNQVFMLYTDKGDNADEDARPDQ